MRIRELTTENTCAIMIDMQGRLMPAMAHREAVTVRTRFLLQCLKILGIPVTVTQQYTKGLGMTEPELMAAGGLTDYLDKITYSCWKDDGIRRELERRPGRRQVLLFGVESHICVLQTALDLTEAGFTVSVVCDCTDSRSSFDREIAFRRMERAGVTLTTSEAAVYELMKQAGNDTFRTISRIVRDTPVCGE